MAYYNRDTYIARNTAYVLDYYNMISDSETTYPMVHYGSTGGGFNTYNYTPIKRFSNLNILISKLDSIQIGALKYVIGTDRQSSSIDRNKNDGYLFETEIPANRMKGTKKYPEHVCVSFHYETNGTYSNLVLTDIIISVSTRHYEDSGNSDNITLDSSIPIKISTYVD